MALADQAAIKNAVRSLLRGSGVVWRVASQAGELPNWKDNPGRLSDFWEVSAYRVGIERYAAGKAGGAGARVRPVEETLTIRLEGNMPVPKPEWGYKSEDRWDTLVPGVLLLLLDNADLDGLVTEHEPPAETGEDGPFAWYADGEKSVRCHHAVIEWVITFDTEYTFTP